MQDRCFPGRKDGAYQSALKTVEEEDAAEALVSPRPMADEVQESNGASERPPQDLSEKEAAGPCEAPQVGRMARNAGAARPYGSQRIGRMARKEGILEGVVSHRLLS